MKLKPPENPNYAATIVTIKQLIPLDNCDNVVATIIFGNQAIVGKATQVGDVCVFFPPECQLSDEFVRTNNLYRHADYNDNKEVKGYFDENRRVRAQRFRGHRSDAFVIPLKSLEYTGFNFENIPDGFTFDELNGHEICRKFVRKGQRFNTHSPQPKFKRVDELFFPKHFDTENYFRNADKIDPDDTVIITQKLHGTSVRIGNIPVKRKLRFRERVAKFFGVKIEEFEYDYVYGSRNVVKDPNNPDQNHFYDSDIYTRYGEQLYGLLPKGFMVYGELIGWTPGGSPIQDRYTYDVPLGYADLYVYRVSYINPDGREFDLTWDQVKEFCKNRALKSVPEISTSVGWEASLQVNLLLDKNLKEYTTIGIPVGKGKVDEGVCLRVDRGDRPLILKAKSPIFLEHETKLFDNPDCVDMEEVG